MSLNTAHAYRAVLIHSCESILLHCKDVIAQVTGEFKEMFPGTIPGYAYLTTHRVIFRSKRCTEHLKSLSAPFVAIDDIKIHHKPVINSHSVSFQVESQPNGHFSGIMELSLFFSSERVADEFYKALVRALSIIEEKNLNVTILPYYIPAKHWYEAGLELHKPPSIYKNWLPIESELFPIPKPNSVYMTENPPSFPGINSNRITPEQENIRYQCETVKRRTRSSAADPCCTEENKK